MTTRISKLLLLAAIALFYSIVVFNNLTDWNSNYQFVRHVLMMDSTFPGNLGMWRAINANPAHIVFYCGIIAWEFTTAVLLWWGAANLFRALRQPAAQFNSAKRIAILGLTLSLLMWLCAFITIGGEWFLMWQSHSWNGQEPAFRNFATFALVLLFLVQPEKDSQP
jgi:predicted small integral membrane protein